MNTAIEKLLLKGYDVSFRYRIGKGGPFVCIVSEALNEFNNFYGHSNKNAEDSFNKALEQFEVKQRLG